MTNHMIHCSSLCFHIHYPIRKLDLAASGDKEARLATQNNLFSPLNKQQFYKNFDLLNSTSNTVEWKKLFSSTGTPTHYQYGCTAKKKLAYLQQGIRVSAFIIY